MKKAILAGFLFLFSSALFCSFSMNPSEDTPGKEPAAITSLIINADVTVVLVNEKGISPMVDGDDYFAEHVEVRQKGKRLVISAKKARDFKSRGVIYVPASRLNRISINSGASVKSRGTLQNPFLSITINGTCDLSVTTVGELKLLETDYYTFIHTSGIIRRSVASAPAKSTGTVTNE